MPKYNNTFRNPEYREESIYNGSGHFVGTIRIKPSSLLWRPSGKIKFFAIPLDKFRQWITDSTTNAKRTAK